MTLRTLLLFACLTAGAASYAQRIAIEAGGGLSSHYSHSKAVGSFRIGLSYEHEFNNNWSVEPGIAFYAKGWKDPYQTVFLRDWDGNLVYDEEGNALTGIKNCSSDANYLEIPVLFNYYLQTRPAHYLVFSAGPYIAYGVGGNIKTQGDTDQEGSKRYFYATKTFDEEGTHRFDAGLSVGISYEFNRQFTVGIQGDFGLTEFNRQGDRNISGLLTVGYRLRID